MTHDAEETAPDDWQVDSLLAFDEALAVGDDPAFDHRTGASLSSVHDCQRLLEAVWPRSAATPRNHPRQLGKFSILSELGRGGFGVVFLASDTVLGRTVALKVPHPEVLVSPEARRRFVREAEAAARLDHPNIVPVFEVGQAGPVGYIASAYCAGGTLASWLREQAAPVSPQAAARIAATLAEAVGHAHERGIVHRDLKPSNILLQPIDSTAADRAGVPGFVPRIGDFGLAKLVDGDDQATRSGVPIGSPTYMAPEQAQGLPRECGPPTDLYALGVILYEMLTGRPPLQGDTQLETLRLVVDRDPPSPRALRPGLSCDLETICLKCLEKRPARRYSTASHLADDLRRFLAGRPITARPLPAWEHAWKWTRRKPAWAALAAVLGLALLGLILGLAWSRESEKRHGSALRTAYDQARVSERTADAQRRLAEEHERQAYRHWTGSQIKRAQSFYDRGDLEGTIDILDGLRPESGRPDDRGFAWSFLKRLCGRQLSVSERLPSVETVAVSPDGQIVAAGDQQGNVLLWEPDSGRVRRVLGKLDARADALVFSPDGRTLASCASTLPPKGHWRGQVKLWDVASGSEWRDLGGGFGRIYVLMFNPDGSRLVTLDTSARSPTPPDTTARFWDLSPERMSASLAASLGPQELAAQLPSVLPAESSDGESGQAPAPVDRASKGREQTPRIPRNLAMSPDGSLLAVAAPDGEIRFFLPSVGCWAATGRVLDGELCVAPLWIHRPLSASDVAHMAEAARRLTGCPRARTLGAGERVLSARFSSDGRVLASYAGDPRGTDNLLRLIDPASGQTIHDFGALHIFTPEAVHFRPHSHDLVYAGQPQRLRLWYHGGRPDPPSPRGHDGEVWSLAFAPDGRTLASAGDDHVIKLWDVASGRERATLAGHTSLVTAVAYAPDGKTLASASFDRTVRVWDAETFEARATLSGHSDRIRAVAFGPDGRTLASTGNDRTVRLWDLESCKELVALKGHTGWGESVLFSADGKTLFSGSLDTTIRSWDWRAERVEAVWQTEEQILAMALAPDGRTLAKAEPFGTVALWDVASKLQSASLRAHSLDALGLAFSTDGRTLATAGRDQTIRLWDPATGQELLTLRGHQHRVHAVAFSPDGTILASGSHDGVIKLWRADETHAVAE